jgi:cytochrome c oxidase subunit I
MDFVEPESSKGPLDWEADRRGETEVAQERVMNGTGEPEQSAATIVEDRPADRPADLSDGEDEK